jgi:hypothetical protein
MGVVELAGKDRNHVVGSHVRIRRQLVFGNDRD